MATVVKALMSDPRCNTVQIATGYWDIPGTTVLINELREFLSRDNTTLQILIGTDPEVRLYQLRKPQFKDAYGQTDFIKRDLHDLEVKDEYVQAVELLKQYCLRDFDESRIQIKMYRQTEVGRERFLHAKCYIFLGNQYSKGIIGSSNFTQKGLGSNFTQKGLEGNLELNYLEWDNAKVTAVPNENSAIKGHKIWFKELWDQSIEWNKIFLEEVLKGSPIDKKVKEKEAEKAEAFTPYELYIKMLQLQFGDIVDKDLGRQIESYLPANIQRLDYQIEAVKRCLSIMHEHGGFMLGDVVGLGKTIVGVLIVKRFLTMPEDDGRERKVLIITPPAIKSGWKKTIALFDKECEDKMMPGIDFITTGSIDRLLDEEIEGDDDLYDSEEFEETLQEKNYGLIIIDESHKFRNSDTQMYKALDNLIQQICLNTGVCPYIGLLSATPQNNRPDDIKNQIYLFERNRNDSTLKKAKGGNLEGFFADINREYKLLINRNNNLAEDQRQTRLEKLAQEMRDCILSDILERRTRTDIEKYYKKDMESQGIVFPKIKGPNNIEYKMDDELAQLFYDTMNVIAPDEVEKLKIGRYLGYYRYRAIEYFSDPANGLKHVGRGNRTVENISNQLAAIMQILLVKRLESSFSAFRNSLSNLKRYTYNMIRMWDNDTIFVCPQIDVNKELDFKAKSKKSGKDVTFEECVNDIRAKIKKLTKEGRNEKGQNAEYRSVDFMPEYYNLIKRDYELITELFDRWGKAPEDPKLDAFKESLYSELLNPEKNTSGKLVIFSEAVDTVRALERVLKNKKKTLVITAKNRDEKEHIIEENFDANYEGEHKNDYDVIITTEVLAEGINLHRANVILNYDTPWNSTRLMQRIGRVNRIGSTAPNIYVYNFMPSAEGDAQIKLVRKAHVKLQAFHTLFGEDSKIFTEAENVVHYDINRAVEGDESPMQKYVYELKQYKAAHPERYDLIERTDKGWEMAQGDCRTGYFMVKAPKSAKLCIRMLNEPDGKMENDFISATEMLEALRTEENTARLPLPQDWVLRCQKALLAYNQYFVRINKQRSDSKKEQAINIIANIYKEYYICKNESSNSLLERANSIVRKGNIDMINKIIALNKEIDNRKSSLYPIQQEEIDEILEQEIGKVLANITKKQGEAEILLGTIK